MILLKKKKVRKEEKSVTGPEVTIDPSVIAAAVAAVNYYLRSKETTVEKIEVRPPEVEVPQLQPTTQAINYWVSIWRHEVGIRYQVRGGVRSW